MFEEYFGKDKSLRHYTQHLLVALGVLAIFYTTYGHLSSTNLLLFFIGSYIIDLEHLFVVFVIRRDENSTYIENASKSFKTGGFKNLAETLSSKHKQFVGLYLHSFVGYPVIWVLLILSINYGYSEAAYILAGVIGHLSFDLFDDYYQLGHVNNWSWMFKK